MRVIAMTPDQINMLPPTERASIIQLVKKYFFNLLGSYRADLNRTRPSTFITARNARAAVIRVYITHS